jgi:hypothetical protein
MNDELVLYELAAIGWNAVGNGERFKFEVV